MQFLSLALTFALAAVGIARPVEEIEHAATLANVTAQSPANGIGSTELPNYHMLDLYTEPNQKGFSWYIDRVMVQYSTCMTWNKVDTSGGITSLKSYKNQQGLPYYCMNYQTSDCTGKVYWWKGVIQIDQLESKWDNQIRSTRCHHGRNPDDYPDPNGGSIAQDLASGSDAQKDIKTVALGAHAPDNKRGETTHLIDIWSRYNQKGVNFIYTEGMISRSDCLNFNPVLTEGGISSSEQHRHSEGYAYYCFYYGLADCRADSTHNILLVTGIGVGNFWPPYNDYVSSLKCEYGLKPPAGIEFVDLADVSFNQNHSEVGRTTIAAAHAPEDPRQWSGWDWKRTLIYHYSDAELKGSIWAYTEEMLDRQECWNWIGVDQNGISSILQLEHSLKRDYYCTYFGRPNCQSDTVYVIHSNFYWNLGKDQYYPPNDWVHSTKCHYGSPPASGIEALENNIGSEGYHEAAPVSVAK